MNETAMNETATNGTTMNEPIDPIRETDRRSPYRHDQTDCNDKNQYKTRTDPELHRCNGLTLKGQIREGDRLGRDNIVENTQSNNERRQVAQAA